MLQSGLIQNYQTRPDVFGARQFAPLPSQKVPLYTLPPIVGNTMYSPGQGESIGTQFFRDQMSPVRNFGSASIGGMRPSMDRNHSQFGQMPTNSLDMRKRPAVMTRQPGFGQLAPMDMSAFQSRRQQLGLGEPNGNSSER